MSTLGIIGAGNIGSNVAKAAIAAGHDVVIANSRGPETLGDLVAELGSDHARAATIEDAAAAGDIVLVAIPLSAIETLPQAPLAGKVVLDANNYYPGRDGRIAALDTNMSTTSGLLQKHLPQSHVVKAFNHINAKDIPRDATPFGTPTRRALAIFGQDGQAKEVATAFIDDLGYDAVDLGTLDESWRLERDTPGYGKPMTAAELREIAANTERVQQQ